MCLGLVAIGITSLSVGDFDTLLKFAQPTSGVFLAVFTIVCSFDLRRVMLEHSEAVGAPVRLSGLWKFLFGPFYLQHRINVIRDAEGVRDLSLSLKRKHEELRGS